MPYTEEEYNKLQADIIELWGEHNAYMIGYITPADIIYHKELRKRIEALKP